MEKNKTIISTNDVMLIVTAALTDKIGNVLKGYNSPLDNIVKNVVNDNADAIISICREALATVVADDNFKKVVKEEFQHKVAKALVAKLEGSVEKAVEVMRQNPILKSQLILQIEKIIKDK